MVGGRGADFLDVMARIGIRRPNPCPNLPVGGKFCPKRRDYWILPCPFYNIARGYQSSMGLHQIAQTEGREDFLVFLA